MAGAAGGGGQGGYGAGGGTLLTTSSPHQPSSRLRLDRRTAARESLLATLQDRTAPLQHPLPRIRLTGRALTELGLMSGEGRRQAEHQPPTEDCTGGDVVPMDAARRFLPRRNLPGTGAAGAGGGGRGLLGRAGLLRGGGDTRDMCLVYEELQPPQELPDYEYSTPRDGQDYETSTLPHHQAIRDKAGMAERGGIDRSGAERGGCEGRLDYAQMPVTLTQLHRIMSVNNKNNYSSTRKLRSNHTIPQSAPGTDKRCDTGHTEPPVLPSQQRSNKDKKPSNIRISIKRDNHGATPKVKLTMKVTLPNITQPPTTASTALPVKRRDRLPAFVSNTRQRTLLRLPPNNGGADYNPAPSVTYPDDCYEDDISQATPLAPAILRQLEATRMRPADRTRRWLVDNPVEDIHLEPPPTPTPPVLSPTPPTPDSGNDPQDSGTPRRRIIKMRLKPKMQEVSESSGKTQMPAITPGGTSTSTKPTKRIRLVTSKQTSQAPQQVMSQVTSVPPVTSQMTSVPHVTPRSRYQLAGLKETAL